MSTKTLLQSIVPTLRVVHIALASLDTNDTGLDDITAREILAASNAIQAYLDSFPQGVKIAQGYTEIKAFCDNALNSLNIVIESDSPIGQKLAQAQNIVNSLTDDSQIYPAKKGKDGELLQKTIKTASEKLEQLKQL